MQEKKNIEASKRLQDWLEAKDLTQRDFSKLIGMTQSWLSLLLSGNKIPTLTQAVEIEKTTKGYVTPSMWLREQSQHKKSNHAQRSNSKENEKKPKQTTRVRFGKNT